MKDKKMCFKIGLIIIILILIICVVVFFKNREEKENIKNIENIGNTEINEILPEENNLSNEEKNQIEELKNQAGITGNTDLYEVQKDYDNKEIAIVKPSVKYKVAFAGMIKNSKPEISELDSIIKENHPKNSGIWICPKDRNTVLKLLTNVTRSQYNIDENGYLKIENNDEQNDNDKKILKAIKGDKLYIIAISSTCYIVDNVTGEILDYSFENMDKYQTYEYFEDDDRMIIFVTENKSNQIDENSVINSVIDLLE